MINNESNVNEEENININESEKNIQNENINSNLQQEKNDVIDSNQEENEGDEESKENITIKRNLGEIDEYEKSIKIIVLGESSVGKSTLIFRLMYQKFRELPTTLSIEYHTYTISLNDYIIRMQIWDTAGQEKFNSIVSNYYKGTDVGIFLYSIDNEDSFINVKNWYNNLKDNSTEKSINILIGNKKDLEQEDRQVTFEQGENFAVENEFMLFREISCKSNEDADIEEIFDEIGKYFYNLYKYTRCPTNTGDMNYVASASMIELGEKQRNKNSKKEIVKCCV